MKERFRTAPGKIKAATIGLVVVAALAAPVGIGIHYLGKASVRPPPEAAVQQAHDAANPGAVSDDAREAIRNRVGSAVDKLYPTEN